MRKIYSTLLLGMLSLFLVSLSAQEKKLVILHTNDTHSHILPFTPDDSDQLMGGVLRRKALVDSIRQANEAVLLVDAGDFFQGTPFFNQFGGEVEIAMLNALQYDVVTLGNHEFDNGVEPLVKELKKATFDVVLANYELSNTALAPLVKPYVIREIDGIRIALVGVSANPEGLIAQKNYAGITYLDPVEVANKVALQAKEEGADVVVLVSHLGNSGDRDLAQKSRNIDIILGGHSHTTLATPECILNLDGESVTIGQTGSYGESLGYMEVLLEEKK